MKFFALLVLLFAFTAYLEINAQIYHPCAFDSWLQTQPDFHEIMDQWTADSRRDKDFLRDDIYTIQVVFHIVYNQDIQNISDDVILEQMVKLNQDYRRLNPDAILTRDEFLPVAADAHIEFELAQFDPEGNPSNGITHNLTERAGFVLDFFSLENTLDEVKSSETGGVNPWDPTRYLNIWVCNIMDTGFGQIFGISYPPLNAPNWPVEYYEASLAVSGVVMHYTCPGPNNPTATIDGYDFNDGGRTLTHEVGHFLGLRHIWGDAYFNGCSVDDGILDTPNCFAQDNFVCNHNINSCSGEIPNLPDMVENYMDYSGDDCMNIFTREQVDMMRWVLTNLRPDLVEGQFVSVPLVSVGDQVEVYPNPATDQINFACSENLLGTVLFLYDSRGLIVDSFRIISTKQNTSVAHIPAGVYYLSAGIEKPNFKTQRLFIAPQH